jgi:hypothetical protein
MEAPKKQSDKDRATVQAEWDAAHGITPEQRVQAHEKAKKQAALGQAQRTERRKKALGK